MKKICKFDDWANIFSIFMIWRINFSLTHHLKFVIHPYCRKTHFAFRTFLKLLRIFFRCARPRVDLSGRGDVLDARAVQGHWSAEQDGLLRDAGGESGRLRVLAHQGPALAQDALAAEGGQRHLEHQEDAALLRRRRQPQLGQPLG